MKRRSDAARPPLTPLEAVLVVVQDRRRRIGLVDDTATRQLGWEPNVDDLAEARSVLARPR